MGGGGEVGTEQMAHSLAPSSTVAGIWGRKLDEPGTPWGTREEFGVISWLDPMSDGVPRRSSYRYARSGEAGGKIDSGMFW